MFLNGLLICLLFMCTSAAPNSDVNVNVKININGWSDDASKNEIGTDEDGTDEDRTDEDESDSDESYDPDVCMFNGKPYANNTFIENSCRNLKCLNAKWTTTISPQGAINESCGICLIYGEPHIQPFTHHDVSDFTCCSTFGTGPPSAKEYSIQKPGDYHIVYQLGGVEVNSNFVACGQNLALACVSGVSFTEYGTTVDLQIPVTTSCYHINDPGCAITVSVGGTQVPIGESVQVFGTLLVFKENNIVLMANLNCVTIVGYKGVTVSLCQRYGDYAFLYIWAQPTLKNELYGLCDTYTDTSPNFFTKQDRSPETTDTNLFALTWKIDSTSSIDLTQQELQVPQSRCENKTVYMEKKDQCNQIIEDEDMVAACINDLCYMPDPDQYAQGYAIHSQVHSHLISHACCPPPLCPLPFCPCC